ncbi:uncharacterized protein LOC120556960 isoform X1 [Perca fluviatilis]|uniref:uncharacterized protein LOC120556960 isoform X1 n=1 Tax=Perca fluviatilis TaxID=8168 RepID=UPI0019642CDD|nr:uncharacterized protein LOC120556960 isoform X1 [Perca fluviatilis]
MLWSHHAWLTAMLSWLLSPKQTHPPSPTHPEHCCTDYTFIVRWTHHSAAILTTLAPCFYKGSTSKILLLTFKALHNLSHRPLSHLHYLSLPAVLINSVHLNKLTAMFYDCSYLRKSENRPEQATIEESSSTESCYLRESENHPEQPTIEESSSTESSESVHEEYPLMMCSENEVEQETCAAPSVQSSENGKESGKKDAACQRPKSQKERTTTSQSENKENRDIQEDENEEFSTSLSVGDGRYLVDLGSSSEFVVDEECLFQLFKSCRECNRQCTVRKRVTGLKLVVSQACCFCQSHSKWTNLPDDDDDGGGDLQINGKQTALEQTNSAKQ